MTLLLIPFVRSSVRNQGFFSKKFYSCLQKRKFQGSFKGVSRKIEGCDKITFELVSSVFDRVCQESFQGVSRKSQRSFEEVSRVFEGSFNSISRKFQGCFKEY